MGYSDDTEVFHALVRAGLWEKDVGLLPYKEVDFDRLLQLAQEQSVVGLALAGLERSDVMPPQKLLLQWIGEAQLFEQRNMAMNGFIAELIDRLRNEGVFCLLVKGQGVAQCYERPLWRSCGDVDLFFDADNYEKAKAYLLPRATSVEPEEKRKKHQAMVIGPWVVELHGLMATEISERINTGVSRVQRDIFENGGVRVWKNEGVDVLLPSPDNDAIIIFTHFLQHFFVGGVGLRQICDWCRLLWTYRDSLDKELLEQRLREMGIMSEWKAFGTFAVEWLGMSVEAMPLYTPDVKWRRKAQRICRVVMDAGNFGHNKDNSYRSKYPRLIEKSITFFRRLGEYVRLFAIFPWDAPRFFVTYVRRRVKATL